MRRLCMNETLKKLKIKEDMSVFYDTVLRIDCTKQNQYDAMLLYVDNKQMLKDKVDMYLPLLKQDGLFWMVFPKAHGKKLEMRRDSGFEYLGTLGFEPVGNVSYDETLSALRFRHISYIKKLTRNESMRLSNTTESNQ